ncbi:MAG: flippase-like domain-containing protein [Clostridiales bacterium]|nr:flippase-like domain-containing protein [Clostridiales bacterium]
MKNKKKIIGNGIFLVLVFGFTLYGVFYGEDLSRIQETIRGTNGWYLFLAVLCVIFFIWGESIILHYLMKKLKFPVKKWKCFLISSVGFFFSCITPSASGGQPMQMVYMKKERIPLPVSSLVLMIVTIAYKTVLVLIGVFLLLFQHGFVKKYLQQIMPVFYLGLFLNVICVTLLLLLVFHPLLMKKIMMKGYDWLVKCHLLAQKPKRLEKLDQSMELYHETAAYLKENFRVVVYVFLITFIQRMVLFAVTYFVYRSFGLKNCGIYELTMLQAVIAVAVDMLPLPGGMGISEKLFSVIFAPVFGTALILPGMILCRGLSYYTELLVSAVMTVTAHLTLGKRQKRKKDI